MKLISLFRIFQLNALCYMSVLDFSVDATRWEWRLCRDRAEYFQIKDEGHYCVLWRPNQAEIY